MEFHENDWESTQDASIAYSFIALKSSLGQNMTKKTNSFCRNIIILADAATIRSVYIKILQYEVIVKELFMAFQKNAHTWQTVLRKIMYIPATYRTKAHWCTSICSAKNIDRQKTCCNDNRAVVLYNTLLLILLSIFDYQCNKYLGFRN